MSYSKELNDLYTSNRKNSLDFKSIVDYLNKLQSNFKLPSFKKEEKQYLKLLEDKYILEKDDFKLFLDNMKTLTQDKAQELIISIKNLTLEEIKKQILDLKDSATKLSKVIISDQLEDLKKNPEEYLKNFPETIQAEIKKSIKTLSNDTEENIEKAIDKLLKSYIKNYENFLSSYFKEVQKEMGVILTKTSNDYLAKISTRLENQDLKLLLKFINDNIENIQKLEDNIDINKIPEDFKSILLKEKMFEGMGLEEIISTILNSKTELVKYYLHLDSIQRLTKGINFENIKKLIFTQNQVQRLDIIKQITLDTFLSIFQDKVLEKRYKLATRTSVVTENIAEKELSTEEKILLSLNEYNGANNNEKYAIGMFIESITQKEHIMGINATQDEKILNVVKKGTQYIKNIYGKITNFMENIMNEDLIEKKIEKKLIEYDKMFDKVKEELNVSKRLENYIEKEIKDFEKIGENSLKLIEDLQKETEKQIQKLEENIEHTEKLINQETENAKEELKKLEEAKEIFDNLIIFKKEKDEDTKEEEEKLEKLLEQINQIKNNLTSNAKFLIELKEKVEGEITLYQTQYEEMSQSINDFSSGMEKNANKVVEKLVKYGEQYEKIKNFDIEEGKKYFTDTLQLIEQAKLDLEELSLDKIKEKLKQELGYEDFIKLRKVYSELLDFDKDMLIISKKVEQLRQIKEIVKDYGVMDKKEDYEEKIEFIAEIKLEAYSKLASISLLPKGISDIDKAKINKEMFDIKTNLANNLFKLFPNKSVEAIFIEIENDLQTIEKTDKSSLDNLKIKEINQLISLGGKSITPLKEKLLKIQTTVDRHLKDKANYQSFLEEDDFLKSFMVNEVKEKTKMEKIFDKVKSKFSFFSKNKDNMDGILTVDVFEEIFKREGRGVFSKNRNDEATLKYLNDILLNLSSSKIATDGILSMDDLYKATILSIENIHGKYSVNNEDIEITMAVPNPSVREKEKMLLEIEDRIKSITDFSEIRKLNEVKEKIKKDISEYYQDIKKTEKTLFTQIEIIKSKLFVLEKSEEINQEVIYFIYKDLKVNLAKIINLYINFQEAYGKSIFNKEIKELQENKTKFNTSYKEISNLMIEGMDLTDAVVGMQEAQNLPENLSKEVLENIMVGLSKTQQIQRDIFSTDMAEKTNDPLGRNNLEIIKKIENTVIGISFLDKRNANRQGASTFEIKNFLEEDYKALIEVLAEHKKQKIIDPSINILDKVADSAMEKEGQEKRYISHKAIYDIFVSYSEVEKANTPYQDFILKELERVLISHLKYQTNLGIDFEKIEEEHKNSQKEKLLEEARKKPKKSLKNMLGI